MCERWIVSYGARVYRRPQSGNGRDLICEHKHTRSRVRYRLAGNWFGKLTFSGRLGVTVLDRSRVRECQIRREKYVAATAPRVCRRVCVARFIFVPTTRESISYCCLLRKQAAGRTQSHSISSRHTARNGILRKVFKIESARIKRKKK